MKRMSRREHDERVLQGDKLMKIHELFFKEEKR